ncbi:FecR domain-containing protein [Sphingomonas sp. BK235]|uniref:FecR family protein n=1 Tax=Sphingomonas sp. BK235 TaxID=2512131 RepID=UPI001046DFCC|nr:FecR domain-containing protein [Sphingomonas sp. BK235]TCP30106.1 FecR family protein [Sphingomonas sp. BK235]
MSNDAGSGPLNEALYWAARLQSPDFDEWEAHIDWLEADSAHPALYRRASLALTSGMRVVEQLASSSVPEAANDLEAGGPPRRSRMGWWLAASGALAASITGLVLSSENAEPDLILRTAPGVTRSVSLADGTSLMLNGGTELTVKRPEERQLVLKQGEIFLRVTHDAERSFEVRVGNRIFQDVGTAFNISAEPGKVRLAVSEGAVAIDPDEGNVLVNAGEAVTINGSKMVLAKSPARTVGSWTRGSLVYANAEMVSVGSDLARSLGVPVSLSPEVARMRFTGAIPLDEPPAEALQRLADLLEARTVKTSSGWTIKRREPER